MQDQRFFFNHLDLLLQILDASTELLLGCSIFFWNAYYSFLLRNCSHYCSQMLFSFLLLPNTSHDWSQTYSAVPTSTVIEGLFSTCSWARLVKQFQCITNNVLNLFGQHTQVYVAFELVSFVFVIIKTLHCMGSTII